MPSGRRKARSPPRTALVAPRNSRAARIRRILDRRDRADPRAGRSPRRGRPCRIHGPRHLRDHDGDHSHRPAPPLERARDADPRRERRPARADDRADILLASEPQLIVAWGGRAANPPSKATRPSLANRQRPPGARLRLLARGRGRTALERASRSCASAARAST